MVTVNFDHFEKILPENLLEGPSQFEKLGANILKNVALQDTPPPATFNDGEDFTLEDLDTSIQSLMVPVFKIYGDASMAGPTAFTMTNAQLKQAISDGVVTIVEGTDGQPTLSVDLSQLPRAEVTEVLDETLTLRQAEGHSGAYDRNTFVLAMEDLLLVEGDSFSESDLVELDKVFEWAAEYAGDEESIDSSHLIRALFDGDKGNDSRRQHHVSLNGLVPDFLDPFDNITEEVLPVISPSQSQSYVAQYDTEGTILDDNPEEPNDLLLPNEFPEDVRAGMKVLYKVYQEVDGDFDYRIYQEGFSADDLDYFESQGIIQFIEPADGEGPVEITVDLNSIPDERLLHSLESVDVTGEGNLVEYGDPTTLEGLTKIMQTVFGFHGGDPDQTALWNEIKAELVPDPDTGKYSAEDVIATMNKLGIEPNDFVDTNASFDEAPVVPEEGETASPEATAFIELYDTSTGSGSADDPWSSGPDGLLHLKEFPDELRAPLLLLRNVHLDGAPGDYIMADEGFSAHDLDYFASQGLIEFNGTSLDINVSEIANTRLATALRPDGAEIGGHELSQAFSKLLGYDNDLVEEHREFMNIFYEATGLDENSTEAELTTVRFSTEDVVAAMNTLGIDPLYFFNA